MKGVFRIKLRKDREYNFDAEHPLIESRLWQVEADGAHVVICTVSDSAGFVQYLENCPAVESFHRLASGRPLSGS